MLYDKVFLTPSPSFYKNKLFSQINKHIRICVIFTGAAYHQRNADFYSGVQDFDSITLPSEFKKQVYLINKFLKNNDFNEIIFGGWDNKITWYTLFRTPKYKNSCVFESSVNDSCLIGVKGFVKKSSFLDYTRLIHQVLFNQNCLNLLILEEKLWNMEVVDY